MVLSPNEGAPSTRMRSTSAEIAPCGRLHGLSGGIGTYKRHRLCPPHPRGSARLASIALANYL